MNFGIIPETVRERAAVRFGFVPVPVIDMLFGSIKTRMIMAGVTLGVFESLRDRPLNANEIAALLSLDRNAVECLLRALSHIKYLVHAEDRYALSALARRTMLRGAPMDTTGYVRWHEAQWRFLEHLETLVRTGEGINFHRTLCDQRLWGHYQRAMLTMARLDAATIAHLVPIRRGATHLLDLGGGHGLVGAAICRRHAPMRSTVIDLPEAVEEGRALTRELDLAGVVAHRAGDLLVDPLEECDAALLSNVLHHFTSPQVGALLARVRAVVRPGGTVAIWDLESPRRRDKVGHGDVVSLFFRLTSTASAYHGSEYENWLHQHGFSNVRVRRPIRSPGRVLVLGTVD